MKTILITGASGFIGSFLVEEALNKGYTVFAGVRTSSDKTFLKKEKVCLFEMDFSDKNKLKVKFQEYKRFFGIFDYVIHNAGVTKTLHKQDFDVINYQYTKNFIEALTEGNCIPTKFVYISSLAAYGPGNENTMLPIKDTDTPSPVSLYGKSKLKAEKYIKSQSNIPYVILRPTGVYGPREKDYYVMYKMLDKGIETYIGTSKQALSFIYVKHE